MARPASARCRKRLGSTIRILTNAGDNYFVKLVRRSDATAIMTATIQGGTPFEARLPRGEYELRYAAGKSWYGEADLFGKDTAFAKTDRFISVSSDGIRTVQLILQRNGNLSSSTIPRENFLSKMMQRHLTRLDRRRSRPGRMRITTSLSEMWTAETSIT